MVATPVSSPIFVKDIKLAASLVTFGARPHLEKPLERVIGVNGQEVCVFNFENTEQTRDMIQAFDSKADGWNGKNGSGGLSNPEHPFWYARAALRNRERWLDAVKKCSVIHLVQKGGKIWLVTTPPP